MRWTGAPRRVIAPRQRGCGLSGEPLSACTAEDMARMRSLTREGLAYEVSEPDHNVHLSRPEAFYAHFSAFLEKVLGALPAH